MKLVNLTPYPIILYGAEGVSTLNPSGQVVTIAASQETVDTVEGVAVIRDVFYGIHQIPEPEDGTIYLVSSLVLAALRDAGSTRTDVLCAATGRRDGAVLGARGEILGVTRLRAL